MQPPHDIAPLLSVGLILLGLLLWGALRGYQQFPPRARRSREMLVRRRQERQQLLQAAADLDDQYAQGMLPQPTYVAERQRLKQRLVELTMQSKRSNPKDE